MGWREFCRAALADAGRWGVRTEQGVPLTSRERLRLLACEWRTLTAEQKQRYAASHCTPPRKPRRRQRQAWNLWVAQHFSEVRAEHPDWTRGAVLSELSRRYRRLPGEQKQELADQVRQARDVDSDEDWGVKEIVPEHE